MRSCWQKSAAPCLAVYHQKNLCLTKAVSRLSALPFYPTSLITGKKQLGMQVQCWLLRELSKLTLIWKRRVCLGFFRLPLSCSCCHVKQFLIPCQRGTSLQACHQHLRDLVQDHVSETDRTTDEKSF